MNHEETGARSGRRVLVVGAGLAGLSAARALSRQGFDVAIVEAGGAVGGRTRSDRDWLPGVAIDRGAEFVGSNHPRVVALAKEFGIPLDPVHEAELALRELDGEVFRGDAAERLYEEALPLRERLVERARLVDDERPWLTPGADQLDRLSLRDGIFAESVGSDHAKRLLCAEFEASEASDPALISWLGQLVVLKGHGLERYWDETEAYRVRGGTASLAETLARELRSPSAPSRASFILDAPVVAIRQTEHEVQASLAGGQNLSADWLVLAVPASQLRKIDLPVELQPLSALFCGAATKEFLRVDASSPMNRLRRAGLSRFAGSVYPAPAGDGAGGSAAMSLFCSSTAAERRAKWETLARRKDLAEVVRELGSPAEAGSPLAATDDDAWTKTDWQSEPFFDGGYSCAQLGKIVDLGELLYSGAGRVVIAGEHASFRFTGYMEGALESAERACRTILDRDGIGMD